MIAGIILFAFGFAYFSISFSIKRTYIDQVVGSRLFPQICGSLLMGLSLMLIAAAIFRLHRNEHSSINQDQNSEKTEKMEKRSGLSPAVKTLLVLLCFALFAWLLDKIGFALAAFLYLFSQMVLMSGRKLTKKSLLFYFVLSLALSGGIYLLFQKGFSLMLPKARWF